MSDEYKNFLKLTQQFRFCPNAFRIDMYKGCDFGCTYCFANGSNFKTGKGDFKVASVKRLKNYFKRAFESDAEAKDLNIELLRKRVPLHCGGMSDPFQTREWTMKLTYELIKLSNQYNYPICFSTKTDHLPEEYFEILNPKLHAFQISIIGWSDEFVKEWERNTPSAQSRLKFMQELRERGFWCSLRLQPLIDFDEAELLITNVGTIPSYITIEHVRIMTPQFELFKKCIGKYGENLMPKPGARIFEISTAYKKENFEKLKAIANASGVLVGAGDNDLHYLSQSRCCCGIDTINENFLGYLKYNITYMTTGEWSDEELYIPKSDCKHCMNQKLYGHKKFVGYEELLKEYAIKHPNSIPNKSREIVEKKLFGISQQKLF